VPRVRQKAASVTLLHETQSPPATIDAPQHLFNTDNRDRYLSDVRAGTAAVVAQLGRTTRPFTGATPAALEAHVAAVDLDEPLTDAAAALSEVERLYLRDAVYFHDVKYAAHLNCPVVIPALVGEAILSAVNSSMDTWDQSAGATLMERHLIQWTSGRLGLGALADGVFTSGGSQSNLQALLIARNRAHQRIQSRQDDPVRLADVVSRLRIFTSAVSHFSIRTSASILGLGADAVVVIPVDSAQRMDAVALDAALASCVNEELIAMAVVATAGTTDFGSIDPLARVADLCARHDTWLHVDAAYGGGLVTSERYRSLLEGIHAADSVTIDYHKTFFQPVSSSAVLLRDGSLFKHVTHHSDYLNPRSASLRVPNQVDKSIQTTRRFDALKLWLTLRTLGADGIGALLDSVLDLARDAYRELCAAAEFEVVVAPALSTLVFRYVPQRAPDDPREREELIDRLNLAVRQAIFDSGEAVIAGTTVNGRHYLKLTLLNASATLDDIRQILGLIRQHAAGFLSAELERPRV